MKYVIARPGGGYYSMQGWLPSKVNSPVMEFPHKQAATDYIADNKHLTGALVEQAAVQMAPGMSDAGAAIFGYKAASRG